MPKLIPIEERKKCICWFCRTNKSVKYIGQILNPCPWADNRYLDIYICNKCVVIHKMHLAEFWKEKCN